MRALVLIPLAVVLVLGCSGQEGSVPGTEEKASPKAGEKGGFPDKLPPEDKPADVRPIGKRNERPAVEVLINKEAKDWWASKCRLGEKVRVRGYILSSRGTWLRVNNCRPYDGPEKSVEAAEMTRDFLADWDRAREKYKRRLASPRFDNDVVVEGIVAGWDPVHYVLILAGHTP